LLDLLHFTTTETDEPMASSKLDLYEWWMMDHNPNLPEPALKPELSHVSQEPEFDLDLISFTEFDDDEIRTGGIDETTLPPPLIPTSYLSFGDMKARNKSSSDDFVDNLFSSELTTTTTNPATLANQHNEPDLMRMLVGRCSPVDSLFSHNKPTPLIVSSESSISETYSVFSPLKESANPPDVSYSQLLGDVFTTNQQQVFSSTPHRAIRPKIAANFNKQI
jgi:hypothetical protein